MRVSHAFFADLAVKRVGLLDGLAGLAGWAGWAGWACWACWAGLAGLAGLVIFLTDAWRNKNNRLTHSLKQVGQSKISNKTMCVCLGLAGLVTSWSSVRFRLISFV